MTLLRLWMVAVLAAGQTGLAHASDTVASELIDQTSQQPSAAITPEEPDIDVELSQPEEQVLSTVGSKTVIAGQADAEESNDLLSRQINDIRPSFDYAWGDVEVTTLPDDFTVNTDDKPVSRHIQTPLLLQWQPSNLWYHPLYFEDAPLERYGHTYSPMIFQSVVSTGRFLGRAATLPYHATLRPMHTREYPLGWYRPGECAPHLKYHPAWNREAAVHQALAVVGLVFLIP